MELKGVIPFSPCPIMSTEAKEALINKANQVVEGFREVIENLELEVQKLRKENAVLKGLIEVGKTPVISDGDSNKESGNEDPSCEVPNIFLVSETYKNHVLRIIVKHIDNFRTLKAGRLVNKQWKEAFDDRFRETAMLRVQFDFVEKPMSEFVNLFNSSNGEKSIPKNLWITLPEYLNYSIPNWLSKYGQQLQTVKLGKPFKYYEVDRPGFNIEKKVFSATHIQSLLTRWCPNLKTLIIPTPFAPYGHPSKFYPDLVKTDLEVLELGSRDNRSTKNLLGTSRFLLDILNCLSSVKTLRLINISDNNLDGVNKNFKNDHTGRWALSRVRELDMTLSVYSPINLLKGEGETITEFFSLRKLSVHSDHCEEAPKSQNMKAFLASVQNRLEELVFLNGFPSESKPEEYLPPKMENLKVLKVLDIQKWENPSLRFLRRFPALKCLELSLSLHEEPCDDSDEENKLELQLFCDEDHSGEESDLDSCDTGESGKNTWNSFDTFHTVKPSFCHENLEELRFQCWSQSKKPCFRGIHRCFPYLKKLEINFHGKQLDSALAHLSWNEKLRELKIHLHKRVEYGFYTQFSRSCGFDSLQKLILEAETEDPFPLQLETIVTACLEACKVRELELIYFEVSKDEYDNVVENLSQMKKRRLNLSLINCRFRPKYKYCEE